MNFLTSNRALARQSDGGATRRLDAAPGDYPWGRVSAAILVVLLLPLLARDPHPLNWYAEVALSTTGFLVLFGLLLQFDGLSERLWRGVANCRIAIMAAAFLALAALVCHYVLDNVPHVSDEVAYQFQARALAVGRLAFPAPGDYQFFEFLHTINDGEKWYGIMNPGWPALLAIGYVVRAPWIMNPLLGAATLVVLYAFYRKADYTITESRLAVLLVGVSPFALFMSGTYMAHTANLFLFAVFLWGWIGLLKEKRLRYAAIAGFAVAVNLLVRPLDTAAATAPFLVYLLVATLRDRKLWPHIITLGAVASSGVLLTWLYNYQLTGDWRLMPMTKYFTDLNPNEKFGLGFGADMGTKLHGPEFPGYYPLDAIRVSSQRIMELLRNLYGLPLVFAVVLALGIRGKRGNDRRSANHHLHNLLGASIATLLALYVFHFYHGIAYGSRHYYLALPAFGVILARLFTDWLASDDPRLVRRVRAGVLAGLLYTVTIAYGMAADEYGHNYRAASAALRNEVRTRELRNAVVLVSQETKTWAWKSAFPLNEYPLDRNEVVFAKDLPDENHKLLQRFPQRKFYRAWVRGTRVELVAVPRGSAR